MRYLERERWERGSREGREEEEEEGEHCWRECVCVREGERRQRAAEYIIR